MWRIHCKHAVNNTENALKHTNHTIFLVRNQNWSVQIEWSKYTQRSRRWMDEEKMNGPLSINDDRQRLMFWNISIWIAIRNTTKRSISAFFCFSFPNWWSWYLCLCMCVFFVFVFLFLMFDGFSFFDCLHVQVSELCCVRRKNPVNNPTLCERKSNCTLSQW